MVRYQENIYLNSQKRERVMSEYSVYKHTEFEYTRQASEELNICRQSIVRCCKGVQRQAGGYKWEYV